MAGCKILIVEDEILIAADIEATLERAGFEVVGTASDFAESVALAESTTPDLVLVDIKLRGGSSGVDVANAIHKRWHIPFIYLTGNSDEKTLAAALATGPLRILTKPFRNEKLIEVVCASMSVAADPAASRQASVPR